MDLSGDQILDAAYVVVGDGDALVGGEGLGGRLVGAGGGYPAVALLVVVGEHHKGHGVGVFVRLIVGGEYVPAGVEA